VIERRRAQDGSVGEGEVRPTHTKTQWKGPARDHSGVGAAFNGCRAQKDGLSAVTSGDGNGGHSKGGERLRDQNALNE